MITFIIPNRNEPNIRHLCKDCLGEFPDAQIVVSDDPDGNGKGWALRKGLERARGDIIIFLDGDGDIHPRMVWRLAPFITDYDIVVGDKGYSGLKSRQILTFLSRIYIRLMFGIPVNTQTGIKMFRRHTIKPWETNSFAADIEILGKAHKLGYRMVEVPVDAKVTRKMKFKAIWETFKESIKIWLALR